jgi:hypothetical protein
MWPPSRSVSAKKLRRWAFEIIDSRAGPGSLGFAERWSSRDEKSLSDLITPMCGEGVAERMWLGFQEIAKAAKLIEKHDPETRRAIAGHAARVISNSKGALPAWVTELKTHYTHRDERVVSRQHPRPRRFSARFTLYYAKKPRVRLPLHQRHRKPLQSPTIPPPAPSPSMPPIESVYNALNSLFRCRSGLQRSRSHCPAERTRLPRPAGSYQGWEVIATSMRPKGPQESSPGRKPWVRIDKQCV